MKKSIFLFSSIVLCLIILVSCAKKKTEEEYLELIKELTASKDYEQVIDNYEQLLEFYPESEQTQDYRDKYLTVLMEMSEKGTEEEQLKYLKKVVDNFSTEDNIEVKYATFRLAALHEEKGDACSEELFNKITPEGYNELSRYLISEEQFNHALMCYQKQLELYPDSENEDKIVFMIGYIYGEYLKEYDKAKEQFKMVIEEYPESELSDDAKWMLENVGKPLEDIVFEKSGDEAAEDTEVEK